MFVFNARSLPKIGATGVDLIKLFGVNLLMLFCKLDDCINVTIIFLQCEKTKIKNSVSKFTPKKFYVINSWNVLYSGRLWPYLLTLYLTEKVCQ
jgi:hypothetical protein